MPSEQYDILLEKVDRTPEDNLRMAAYKLYVPDAHIENYVGYYTLIGKGKPDNWAAQKGTDLWYEDDWYLMEHTDFYKDVYLKVLGNQGRDFTKVPAREVFNKYLTYLTLAKGDARMQYRIDNPDLDAWGGIKFGWKPATAKKTTTTVKGRVSTAKGRVSTVSLLESQGLLEEYMKKFR